MIDVFLRLSCHAFLLPIIATFAVLARIYRKLTPRKKTEKPRLLWGGVPLLSLKTASNAMQTAGYSSITVSSVYYPTIETEDFDYFIALKRRLPYGLNSIINIIRASVFFIWAMFTRDILHGFFNGALLGKTPLVEWEYSLWKLSGGKLVLMPYGSDSFVYSRLPDTAWAKNLMETYPHSDQADKIIAKRLDNFTELADSVVGCIVHNICLPRTDYLPVLWYPFDDALSPNFPQPTSTIKIAHATNHRLVKGTDIIENVIGELINEGHNIELSIIENKSHAEVLAAFNGADIVIDQLLFGYAMSALEACALGKPVISGITDHPMYDIFRQQSELDKSAIIFANPDTLKRQLLELLSQPQNLNELGRKTRAFAEKSHGNAATIRLFEQVYNGLD